MTSVMEGIWRQLSGCHEKKYPDVYRGVLRQLGSSFTNKESNIYHEFFVSLNPEIGLFEKLCSVLLKFFYKNDFVSS